MPMRALSASALSVRGGGAEPNIIAPAKANRRRDSQSGLAPSANINTVSRYHRLR